MSVFAYVNYVKDLNPHSKSLVPFKQVIKKSYNYRAFIYGSVYFPEKISSYPFLNFSCTYPKLTHIPSLTNFGFGNFHFWKLLKPTYHDYASPRCFSFSYHDQRTPNFTFDVFSLLSLTCKNTSAGYSYYLRTKNRNHNLILHLLSRIVPRKCFTVIKYAEKKELLPKKSYFKKNKTRLFAVVDAHIELAFRILLQKAMDVLLKNKKRPFKIGFSIFHHGIQKMYYWTGFKLISLDGSSFDSSLSIWLMCGAMMMLLRDANYTQYERAIVMAFFIDFIVQPRMYRGLLFSLFSGLPSGFLLTALLNCYIVEFIMEFIYLPSQKIIHYLSSGDDIAMPEEDSQFFCDFSKYYGVDYEKSNSLVYLSFTPRHTKYGPIAEYKEIGKCFSTLAYLEDTSNTIQLTSTFVSLFVIYFYHFFFHPNSRNYFHSFMNIYRTRMGIHAFSPQFLLRQAMMNWFGPSRPQANFYVTGKSRDFDTI